MLLLVLVAVAAGAGAAGRADVTAGLVGAWLAWYALACWLFPFRPCRWCHGSGKRWNDRGTAYRTCRWCHGLRIERWGRRVWTRWRHGS